MLFIKDEKSFIQEITKINYLNQKFIKILLNHKPENNTENFIDFPPRYTINLHNCDLEILDKLIIILTPLNNLIKQISFYSYEDLNRFNEKLKTLQLFSTSFKYKDNHSVIQILNIIIENTFIDYDKEKITEIIDKPCLTSNLDILLSLIKKTKDALKNPSVLLNPEEFILVIDPKDYPKQKSEEDTITNLN